MAGKLIVRVKFVDGSIRSFAVAQNAAIDELLATVIEKLEIKEGGNFSMFELKDDLERFVDGEEKPAEIMKSWSGTKDKDTNFVFKKRVFVRDDAKELEDPVARQYVYLQAVANVIDGSYPCSVEDAERLAGFQLQVIYGDHNAESHSSGFLNHHLQNFIPKPLLANKKPAEWEAKVFAQHKKNAGMPAEQAQIDYLNVVKKWDFYGSTFFPQCKFAAPPKVGASSNARQAKKVILGVNQDGILLIKPKDRSLVSKHPYTEICSWASSPTTFAFEFGNQADSTKYQFDTKHGALIASTIQTYIDILVDMLTTGDMDEEENTNTLGSDVDSDAQ